MFRFAELLLVLYLMRLYLYSWRDDSFHTFPVKLKFFEQSLELARVGFIL